MQLQLSALFFTFSLGTRTHYFGRTILLGGAGDLLSLLYICLLEKIPSTYGPDRLDLLRQINKVKETETVDPSSDEIIYDIGFHYSDVQTGSHDFTYDHVYGNSDSPSSLIFEECVEPLVNALFHSYNATVLAYGQTGSGKTYTMGTNYNGEDNNGGIIPQVMGTIFKNVGEQTDNVEFLIRVSFVEPLLVWWHTIITS